MKKNLLPFLFLILFFFAIPVHAQSSERIWLSASTTQFKTGETVVILVNGISTTPIQGLTFQIRFDPACIKPIHAASSIPGMNGLQLPQTSGLVDASFASTAPQIANGVLAEVRFITLSACETSFTLENAALVVKDAAGFAAPLSSLQVDQSPIALAISAEKGSAQELPLLGTPLPLGSEPEFSSQTGLPMGTSMVLGVIGMFLLLGIFFLIRILRSDNVQV